MVQNEGYDIKLGTVNFDGDTTSTGSRRTLMVTSLDNDEATAGNAVYFGEDTKVRYAFSGLSDSHGGLGGF